MTKWRNVQLDIQLDQFQFDLILLLLQINTWMCNIRRSKKVSSRISNWNPSRYTSSWKVCNNSVQKVVSDLLRIIGGCCIMVVLKQIKWWKKEGMSSWISNWTSSCWIEVCCCCRSILGCGKLGDQKSYPAGYPTGTLPGGHPVGKYATTQSRRF